MLAVAVLVNKLFNIDAFDPEFNKNCAFPSELLKSKRLSRHNFNELRTHTVDAYLQGQKNHSPPALVVMHYF